MASMTVRFPNGEREFRHADRPLVRGDILLHDGEQFRVLDVSSDGGDRLVVTVEPHSDDVGDLIRSEEGAIQLWPTA
jgi:hypothetical protein